MKPASGRHAGPAVLALCFLFVFAAAPMAEADDYYLRARAGVYSPSASDADYLDAGYGGEITLGKSIVPMVSAELSAGYYEASKGSVDLSVKPVTLALRVRAPIPVVKPYALAGGGAYFSKLEDGRSESDTSFGYFAGAGVDFKVLIVNVNVEAKYFVTEASLGAKTDLDGYVVSAGVGLEF